MASGMAPLMKMEDVYNHLLSCGYRVSLRTLNRHKAEGKFRAMKSGNYKVAEVEAYASMYLDRSAVDGDVTDKTAAEIRRINADADMRELRYQQALGLVMDTSQIEVEFSKRAQGLKNYFDSFARGMAGQAIKVCNGDKEKESVLRDFFLAAFKKAFDNYSRPIIIDNDDDV